MSTVDAIDVTEPVSESDPDVVKPIAVFTDDDGVGDTRIDYTVTITKYGEESVTDTKRDTVENFVTDIERIAGDNGDTYTTSIKNRIIDIVTDSCHTRFKWYNHIDTMTLWGLQTKYGEGENVLFKTYDALDTLPEPNPGCVHMAKISVESPYYDVYHFVHKVAQNVSVDTLPAVLKAMAGDKKLRTRGLNACERGNPRNQDDGLWTYIWWRGTVPRNILSQLNTVIESSDYISVYNCDSD
jgi:hypothetical protein